MAVFGSWVRFFLSFISVRWFDVFGSLVVGYWHCFCFLFGWPCFIVVWLAGFAVLHGYFFAGCFFCFFIVIFLVGWRFKSKYFVCVCVFI